MEQTEGQNGTAPLKKSLARLPKHLAHLRVPDGREIGEVDAADLRRIMARLDVPFALSDGRETLAELWWQHLERIGDDAAHAAVESYLRASR